MRLVPRPFVDDHEYDELHVTNPSNSIGVYLDVDDGSVWVVEMGQSYQLLCDHFIPEEGA